MAYEFLWESHFVKLSIPIYGRTMTFDCDSNIAEVIKILNEKGYYTGNCCEGHPYRKIDSKNPRKYDNIAYFDGGYILFCEIEDKEYFFSKLNEKCNYFIDNKNARMLCTRESIEWKPFKSIDIDGKKNSEMQFSFMTKVIRSIYEDIWKILLETAKELPYKEK